MTDKIKEVKEGPHLIIDINTVSIPYIPLSVKDILELWTKQRILIYDGNQGEKPIVINGGDLLAIDVVGMGKADLGKIMKELKKKV